MTILIKPTEIPEFARTTGLVTTPSNAKKDLGWENTEKPPASFFNWLARFSYLWINYFQQETDAISLLQNGGWHLVSDIIPTRSVSDDPTYELTFASTDLTSIISSGMRIKFTQNSTVRYFIITKVELSGSDTLVTLFGGTDYDVDDTSSFAISDLFFSYHKVPLGFPIEPTKWTVAVIDTTDRNQGTPVGGTWYNLGSVSIDVPIGSWNLTYSVTVHADGSTWLSSTLSTGSSSESDNEFTSISLGSDTSDETAFTGDREKFLDLTTKTTYYLNSKVDAGSPNLDNLNSTRSPAIVRAISNYL